MASSRKALDKFLVQYILACDLPRHPMVFLTRSTPKPSLNEVLLKAKKRGAIGSLSSEDIKFNSHIAKFIDWVLLEKLSIEDDLGHRNLDDIE